MKDIYFDDIKIEKTIKDDWSGTTYYVIGNYWYDTSKHSEYQARCEYYEAKVKENINECIRKIAKHISDKEYWSMYTKLVYIFKDQAAYGDWDYFLNISDGKYYKTYTSIGD